MKEKYKKILEAFTIAEILDNEETVKSVSEAIDKLYPQK